jgi:hypothetical protein
MDLSGQLGLAPGEIDSSNHRRVPWVGSRLVWTLPYPGFNPGDPVRIPSRAAVNMYTHVQEVLIAILGQKDNYPD